MKNSTDMFNKELISKCDKVVQVSTNVLALHFDDNVIEYTRRQATWMVIVDVEVNGVTWIYNDTSQGSEIVHFWKAAQEDAFDQLELKSGRERDNARDTMTGILKFVNDGHVPPPTY